MDTGAGMGVVSVLVGAGDSVTLGGSEGGLPPKGSGAGARRRFKGGGSGVYVQRGMALYLPIIVDLGKQQEGGAMKDHVCGSTQGASYRATSGPHRMVNYVENEAVRIRTT